MAFRRLRKEKSTSLVFALSLGFLLDIVVWCMCPLMHPRNGTRTDRVQVSFISHSFPEARVLGVKVFRVTGLGEHL